MQAEAAKEAEREVRLAYVLNAVAEAENITVTEEDVAAKIKAILEKSQPQERANLEKALTGSYRDRIQSEVRESKLFAWLTEHAKVKEVKDSKGS